MQHDESNSEVPKAFAGEKSTRHSIEQHSTSARMYKLATAGDQPPTNRSYWVVPDQFLAGSYPGELDEQAHEEHLQKLWRCGICTIVNLMEPTAHSLSSILGR